MTRFSRPLRLLSFVPMLLASVTLFLLMVMTFFDVLLRSAINAPIPAAPELTRMAVAIIVFASLPVLSWRGEHINVDLLDGIFHRLRIARVWNALLSIVCGAMLWWPAVRVFDLAERARKYGDLTEFLAIPTFYIEWFIGIATLVTMVILILRGVLMLVAPHILGARA